MTQSFDIRLLDHLACPATHAPLRFDAATDRLIADESGLTYPVRDGIAILLVDEAQPLGASS